MSKRQELQGRYIKNLRNDHLPVHQQSPVWDDKEVRKAVHGY